MNQVTYIGGCDVIRLKNFRWAEFKDTLIEGNQYDIHDTLLTQRTYIKKDNQIIPDDSGQRYRYYQIIDEKGDLIYVWDGFFNGIPL